MTVERENTEESRRLCVPELMAGLTTSDIVAAMRIGAAVGVLSVSTGGCAQPDRNAMIGSREKSCSSFRIRIREFRPWTPVLFSLHYFYTLESTAARSSEWREILVWDYGDNVPVQHELVEGRVHCIGDRGAYAFFNASYLVTTDAGYSWSRWDLATWRKRWFRDTLLIQDAGISADGSGYLIAVEHPVKEGRLWEYLWELKTADYGVHWTQVKQTETIRQ